MIRTDVLPTTSFVGPLPWTSYDICIGPPRPSATATLPFCAGFRSHVTCSYSGCFRSSAAVRGGLPSVNLFPSHGWYVAPNADMTYMVSCGGGLRDLMLCTTLLFVCDRT